MGYSNECKYKQRMMVVVRDKEQGCEGRGGGERQYD